MVDTIVLTTKEMIASHRPKICFSLEENTTIEEEGHSLMHNMASASSFIAAA